MVTWMACFGVRPPDSAIWLAEGPGRHCREPASDAQRHVSRSDYRRLAFAFAITAIALFGQSADTGILGRVTDQSGSVVVGATMTISSPAIGFNKSEITGADGQYELRYLLPEDHVVLT
jgi:hypothetical protein